MSSYTIHRAAKGRYLRFANGDGKVWIVPMKNMRTALNLYQPSSLKGLMVKWLLPYLYWIPTLQHLIRAERVDLLFEASFEQRLSVIFNSDSLEFSIFEGAPSVHQKVTIQLSHGEHICGYCKVSSNRDVVQLFAAEAEILAKLHNLGVDNIPHTLYCGTICDDNERSIFVQSTIKSNSSEVIHKWRGEHSDFLEQLHEATKREVAFEESDFAQSLKRLDGYFDSLTPKEQEVISKATESVRAYYGNESVIFSAYHADFTPWNMFFERGRLFVFDFEYASMSYPPYLDWFHFFTQTAIFERHLTAEAIISEFLSYEIDNREILYRAYLLDVISRYIDREGGDIGKLSAQQIAFWIDILEMI